MAKKSGFLSNIIAAPVNEARAAILDWLGVPISLTDTDFWASYADTQRVAGQTVNEQTALTLSAVWACTRLISETISTLPLHIYENVKGTKVQADHHPLGSIIRLQPNAEATATVYWQANIAAALLRGNGISKKLYSGEHLVGLEFLPYNRLHFECRDGKRKTFERDDSGHLTPIPDDRIFRLPGFSLNGKTGVSVIEYGASVFGSGLAASETANRTFENGLAPTVAFKMDRILKKDQREEFRKNLADVAGALNAGKSPLLEGGMDAKTIGINPKDAQLLESRAFSVEEVARWYGVDPSLIGHGSSVSNWGTGLEQKMISFLVFTLRPWLTRIEQAINRSLFWPVGQSRFTAEYSVEGLLRADSEGRAKYLQMMTSSGIMSIDEARAKENLPPRGGNADRLMTNGATQPIDSLGIKKNEH